MLGILDQEGSDGRNEKRMIDEEWDRDNGEREAKKKGCL